MPGASKTSVLEQLREAGATVVVTSRVLAQVLWCRDEFLGVIAAMAETEPEAERRAFIQGLPDGLGLRNRKLGPES
jgi:hypothetical protein